MSLITFKGFPGGSVVRILLPMQETWVQSLIPKDPLEKEIATHSSMLAWKNAWMEEPGVLQFMKLQTVGHDLTTEKQQQQIIFK